MRAECESRSVVERMTGPGARFAGSRIGATGRRGLVVALWAAVLVLFAGQAGMSADAAFDAAAAKIQNHSTRQPAPSKSVYPFAPRRVSPREIPNQPADEEGVGIVMQLAPMAAESVVRWQATMLKPGNAAASNALSRVRVKVEQKPVSPRIYLAFIIALFMICLTGVTLMWRQFAKPAEPDRPGWERWRH